MKSHTDGPQWWHDIKTTDSFIPILREFFRSRDLDLLCVTETWLGTASFPNSKLMCSGMGPSVLVPVYQEADMQKVRLQNAELGSPLLA